MDIENINFEYWKKHVIENHFKGDGKNKKSFFIDNYEGIVDKITKNYLKYKLIKIEKCKSGKNRLHYIFYTNYIVWFDKKENKYTKNIKVILEENGRYLVTMFPFSI